MKTLNIKIGNEDLKFLKENKYAMCFALQEKDMGYDMICCCSLNYLLLNTIGVGKDYEIFCCQSITDHQRIRIAAGPVPIATGDQITITSSGLFSSPVSGTCPDALELINEYGNLYPGFSRQIDWQGNVSFVPVFVAPYASVKGSYTMKPDDTVKIWFEQFTESGIFLKDFLPPSRTAGRSKSIEILLTDNETDLLYENGNWQKNC